MAGGMDKTVRVLDAASGENIAVLETDEVTPPVISTKPDATPRGVCWTRLFFRRERHRYARY